MSIQPFFNDCLMKRVFTVLGSAAAAAALLCGCSKQENAINVGTVQMSIVAGLDEGTKTVLGADGSVAWSTSGEKLEVLQVAGTGTAATAKVSSEGTTSDEGQTMTFGVSFNPSDSTSFAYYALYPSSAYAGSTDVKKLKVELASSQTPTASSFGAGADILVAKPVTGLSTQPSTLDLQFARIVAVGKMSITDLNTAENVKSVTFTADGKTLAGKSYVNLTTGLVEEYGYSGTGIDNIILDYSAQTIAANGMTAYFTCWPCAFAKDDTFTVVIETETKRFTKTVTVPSDDALAFKEGRASAFTVSFSGIEGENVAVDLNAAYLSYDEIKDKLPGQYATCTYDQSNGASWTVYGMNQSAIQLGKCTTDCYLKLPDFTENITSVTVTLSEAPKSGNSLLLATSKSATTGDIASLTGDGSKTEFTFDLSEKEVKTAYLRASGAAAKILSVLVIVGEDVRTALSTPVVIADLEKDSANSIEVSWGAVENAGSYVVTATPTEGKAVSKTVTETSCTFTDLTYETKYSISVVAKSSDYILYLDSAAGTSEDVTTLAKPSGPTLYNEDFSGTTVGGANSYNSDTISWTHESSSTSWSVTYCSNKTTSLGTNKKNLAIGGSDKEKGSVTFSGQDGITALSFDYKGVSNATTLKITVKNASDTVYEKETSISKNSTGSVSLTTTDFNAACDDTFTVTIANSKNKNAIQISAISWTSAK